MPETLPASQSRRPMGVTLLALLVFTIAGLNLLRLTQALREWNFLADLTPGIPTYMLISGLVWLVAYAGVGWGLWRGKRWASLATILILFAYVAYYWIDLLYVAEDGAQDAGWRFSLAFQLILLSFAVLTLLGKAGRRFFGEAHDG